MTRGQHLDSALASDQQTAEDLTSETFLAAFRSVGAFDQRCGTVYGWLLGIARNKLRDHFRRAARMQVGTTSVVEVPGDSGGPVYRRSGGYSYHNTIPGPIGSVLGPLRDARW